MPKLMPHAQLHDTSSRNSNPEPRFLLCRRPLRNLRLRPSKRCRASTRTCCLTRTRPREALQAQWPRGTGSRRIARIRGSHRTAPVDVQIAAQSPFRAENLLGHWRLGVAVRTCAVAGRPFDRRFAVAHGSIFTGSIAAPAAPRIRAKPRRNTTRSSSDVSLATRAKHRADSAAAEQECLERLGRDRDDSANEGCEAELSAYLKCANASPGVECSAIAGEPLQPHVGSSCSEKQGVLSECITGVPPYCGVGFGPGHNGGSCTFSCPEFSSTCTGPSQFGPLECTCETGPKAGVTFQGPTARGES